MITYTLEELQLFRAIVADLKAGKQVDAGTCQRFHVLGWLRQIGEAPGWALTDKGEQQLK